MLPVWIFTAVFLFVAFMVWRGKKQPYLELDVEAIPHDDPFEGLTEDEKITILKVNYFNAIAKLVFYTEEDGTEGVYVMSKKNEQLAWTRDLEKMNITKQNNNNGGNK